MLAPWGNKGGAELVSESEGHGECEGPDSVEVKGNLATCQFSPDMGPPIFGQDGPLAEMAHGKLLLKKW